MAPPPEKSPYRLLVEGSDDLHSVIHLLARHGFAWDDARTIRPFIQETGGIDKLLDAFPIRTAIKAQVFRHDSGDALRFVGWFRRLFGDS